MGFRASLFAAAVILASAWAGCIGGDGKGDGSAKDASPHGGHEMVSHEAHRLTVWGLVSDDAFQPLAGAVVKAVTGDNTTTNETGGFELPLVIEMGASLLLTASAPGHEAASARVTAHNESRVRLDFRLRAVPGEEPYHHTQDFGGVVSCSVVVWVGEDHGGGAPGQELDCGENDPNDRRTFTIALDAAPQGLLLEFAWEPTTDLARQFEVGLDIGGVDAGHAVGPSVLRVALGAGSLEPIAESGDVRIEVAVAGMTEGEEEGAATMGGAFQQSFTLYATAFYGGAMDDGFTAVPA